jgi:hypothetical protein
VCSFAGNGPASLCISWGGHGASQGHHSGRGRYIQERSGKCGSGMHLRVRVDELAPSKGAGISRDMRLMRAERGPALLRKGRAGTAADCCSVLQYTAQMHIGCDGLKIPAVNQSLASRLFAASSQSVAEPWCGSSGYSGIRPCLPATCLAQASCPLTFIILLTSESPGIESPRVWSIRCQLYFFLPAPASIRVMGRSFIWRGGWRGRGRRVHRVGHRRVRHCLSSSG